MEVEAHGPHGDPVCAAGAVEPVVRAGRRLGSDGGIDVERFGAGDHSERVGKSRLGRHDRQEWSCRKRY